MISERASEATPWWAPRVVPPKGAPHVLVIMTDDAGFAAPSTFGGVIPTPGLGKGGAGTLSVDGEGVAANRLERTTPITFHEDESFDVGLDIRAGVALPEHRHDSPFRFTGEIDKRTVDPDPAH